MKGAVTNDQETVKGLLHELQMRNELLLKEQNIEKIKQDMEITEVVSRMSSACQKEVCFTLFDLGKQSCLSISRPCIR